MPLTSVGTNAFSSLAYFYETRYYFELSSTELMVQSKSFPVTLTLVETGKKREKDMFQKYIAPQLPHLRSNYKIKAQGG